MIEKMMIENFKSIIQKINIEKWTKLSYLTKYKTVLLLIKLMHFS